MSDILNESDNSQQKLVPVNSRKVAKPGILRHFAWKRDKRTTALLLQNSDLVKELGDVRRDFDQYKRDAEAEVVKMKSEINLKSEEIEKLKIFEQLASRISQLENKVIAKAEENIKMSGDVRSGIERVEKSLNNMTNMTTEMTLRATFDVSTLTEERTYSQSSEFAGMNWRTFLYKMDDHLAIHLEGQKTNKSNPCSAFVEFQLISQKSEEIVYRRKAKKVDVYNGDNGWGFEKFISLKDLFDGEKGYVMNDSLIVAAAIRAFPLN